MKPYSVVTIGMMPRVNDGKQHQQDRVQDARGICGSLVGGFHGNAQHYTKTMVIYETQ